MRVAAVVGCLAVVAVFVVVVTTGMVSSVVEGNKENTLRAADSGCNAALGPIQAGDVDKGRLDAARLNEQELAMASLIISIGRQRNIPPLGWQVAIQAAMTESRLTNVDHG